METRITAYLNNIAPGPMSMLLAWALLFGVMMPLALPAWAENKVGGGAEKTFSAENFGYSLHYPAEWEETRPEPYTLILSGPLDSPDFYTTVAIRNLKADYPDQPERSAKAVIRLYQNELRLNANNPTIALTADFLHQRETGPFLRGVQSVVQFGQNGDLLRQWAVAIPRRHAPVVHLWIFTAPVDLFDEARPIAQDILESLTLVDDTPRQP